MLYLLGGENIYQSSAKLEKLIDDFVSDTEGEVQVVNADEVNDYSDILKGVDGLSLFNKEKLIVIKRIFKTKKNVVDKVCDFINERKHLNIVFWEDRKIDKRTKLYKVINKKGIVEEFEKLNYTSLKTWIKNYIKDSGLSLESGVVEDLIFKVGDNQLVMKSSIDNLILLTKINGDEVITGDLLDLFVERTAEESIWDFLDTLSEGDKGEALRAVERLLSENSDFSLIIAMLARQLRLLIMIRVLLDKGMSYSEISSELKLHPFVLRKTMKFAKNFSVDKLKKLFLKLLKTDFVVKTGRFDEYLALDLFITAV